MSVYLDYNATAPIRISALDSLLSVYKQAGNPSSVHGPGRVAKQQMQQAREKLARYIKCRPDDLIFTSGGTECNNLAISNFVNHLQIKTVLINPCEHPSNIIPVEQSGVSVVYLPVQDNGLIDIAKFNQLVQQQAEPFLSIIMLANNETGIIQPMQEISEIVHEAGGFLHVDAAQAFGKIPVNFADIGADTMTLVAHKLGGPVGVGALVVRCGLELRPQMLGGSQEIGRRAGTSNVPGIVGFAVAVEESIAELAEFAKLAAKRDNLIKLMRGFAPDLIVFGQGLDRLPNTLCCAALGFTSETQVMALDLAGFAISSGSACSSGKVKSSHVLQAMQVPAEQASCAVRISMGRDILDQQLEEFANAWGGAYARAAKGQVT